MVEFDEKWLCLKASSNEKDAVILESYSSSTITAALLGMLGLSQAALSQGLLESVSPSRSWVLCSYGQPLPPVPHSHFVSPFEVQSFALIFVESDLLHLVPYHQFSKKIWNWILAGKVLVNLPTAIQPQALQVHIFVSLPKSQVPFLTTPGSWGVAHGPDLALIKPSRMF